MIILGNKKALNLDGTGFDVVNKGISTMNNIQQIAAPRQYEIDQEQLLDFVDTVKTTTEEMHSLCYCIIQKAQKHSAEHNLAKILLKMIGDLRDESLAEIESTGVAKGLMV